MIRTRWILVAAIVGLATSIAIWRPLLRAPPMLPNQSSAGGLSLRDCKYDVCARVYDVRDFIPRPHPMFEESAAYASDRASRGQVAFLAHDSPSRERAVDQLIDALSTTLRPTPSGDAASMRELSGHLIVTHTAQGQARLAFELVSMRWRRDTFAFTRYATGTIASTIFAVLLLRRLVPSARGVTRLHSRLCLSCGYDLRATPHRCPECGAIPPAAVNSPA